MNKNIVNEKFENTMRLTEAILCHLNNLNEIIKIPELPEEIAKSLASIAEQSCRDHSFSRNDDKEKKPPIGIVPEGIWIDQRKAALILAINRYYEAGKMPPKEWWVELEKYLKQ